MKSIVSLGLIIFALTFCGLGDKLKQISGGNGSGANTSSNGPSKTSSGSVETPKPTAAQQAIIDGGTETTWDAQGISWRLPSGNALFSLCAHADRMHGFCMPSSDDRRLMSPPGRNREPVHARAPVAACPDDRALCPVTTSPPSERNHAHTRLGTAPVGPEAGPPHNRDPLLTHRAPEGGLSHFPVPG